jgi:uncharacterized RDD family membrane protein YckC
MIYDLQKASVLKRISAGILDFIIVVILATGFFFLFSTVFNYDSLTVELNTHYDRYVEEYGFDFRELTQEKVDKFTEEEKTKYEVAAQAFREDKEIISTLGKILSMTLVMLTFGILLAILIVEFLVPLILKNGQTLGKKMFGICLMMDNGVQIKTLPLFVRTILGKFTIETMIPVYFLVHLYFGNVNLIYIFILAALLIAEMLLIIINHKNALLHDLMSYTVVVDKESQMIFDTEEELIKYKQEVANKNATSKKTF